MLIFGGLCQTWEISMSEKGKCHAHVQEKQKGGSWGHLLISLS